MERHRACFSIPVLFAVASAVFAQPALAGCGLDPICAISESAGSGAGRGFAESVRPLVMEVMEQQAPALIAQLQTAVDHNILTAEQAGQRLVDYATALFDKAADDLINKVQDRTKSLIDYASLRTLEIEEKIVSDVHSILKQLDCQGKAMANALERQQAIAQQTVNNWIPKIKFWSHSKTEMIEAACRKELSVPAELTYKQIENPTLAKLWRCVRLNYVDPYGPAAAIKDAYDEVVVNDQATMCALQYQDEPLKNITAIWIHDTQSARAWGRELRNE